MSQVNFTRKVFLEQEELNRFQEFLQDDIAQNTIISNTTQFGIIQSDFVDPDTNFLVSQGTGSGTIQFAKDQSQALDADGDLIRLLAIDNIDVTDDSNWYWVRISHVFRRHEVGTVSVNTNGQMTGVNTSFGEVLRGQVTDVPVRIKFQQIDGSAAVNNGNYEVVSIIDNTNAVLTSTVGFQAESNLQYVVIGSVPIGEVVSPTQLGGIYFYDSCSVELVEETTLETAPDLPANGEGRYFYVARVMNTSGTVTVQDKRDIDDTYWKFSVPGIQGAIIRRTLPAPPEEDQYMLLGSINGAVTHYTRFFFQGCGPNEGSVIDLRISNVRVGTNNVASINDVIVTGGAATFRPRFRHYVNSATNRVDIYVQSTTQTPVGPFIPGYIVFVGETIEAGNDGFEYADSFTWSDTEPPTPNVLSATRFLAYGTSGVVDDVNELIDEVSTDVTNLEAVVDGINDTLSVREVFINGPHGTNITDRGIYVRQYGLVVVATGFFDHNGTDGVSPIFRLTPANGIGLVTGLVTLDIYAYAGDNNDTGAVVQLVRGVDGGVEYNQLETINEAVAARRHYFNMSWIIR